MFIPARISVVSPVWMVLGVVASAAWAGDPPSLGVSSCRPVVTRGALPPGFQLVRVTPPLNLPTSIVFTPDGRMFIGEKAGAIRVVRNEKLLSNPLITISTNVETERGLTGMALDPSFADTGHLFVRYTTLDPPRNRVSRFTVVGDVADPHSEFVVWESSQDTFLWHQGGGLEFGKDGTLYMSYGDNADPASSQDLATPYGKLLRMDPRGFAPADNPFVNVLGADPFVWALGLRNAFRFTFDPHTGRLWIGDVGGNGKFAYEELNLGQAGANYGWPAAEGDVCYDGACGGFTWPVHFYRHDDGRYSSDLLSASITLGPVYRGGAYPADYDGCIFFGDFPNQWIRRLRMDESGAPLEDLPFLDAPGAGTVVDLKIGPDGLLYFASIGFGGEGDVPAVYRVEYFGESNKPPVAVATATPRHGDAPLTVTFAASESYDVDGGAGELGVCWDFGDGSTSSSAVAPQHTYSRRGLYHATLTVTDGDSAADTTTFRISVGNPPLGQIVSPELDRLYRAGETVEFAATGTDALGRELPPSAFTWEVLLVHGNHLHPFMPAFSGARSGSFVTPTSGHEPENTHFRVVLTLRDVDDLATTLTRDVGLLPATLLLETDPPKLPLYLDGHPTETPRTYVSVVDFHHTLEAPPSVEVEGASLVFAGWGDGVTDRIREFDVPEQGAGFVARYGAPKEPSPGGDPATASDTNTPSAAGAACCAPLGFLMLGGVVLRVLAGRRDGASSPPRA